MIPHIIHYCWYGKPISTNKLALQCLKSWSRLKAEKVLEWNYDNCPCNENDFVKKAKEEKQYAFISDYYRLKALYKYGGIYMDTDIEVKKALPEDLYNQKCIFGFMYDNLISTAFIMAEKHSDIIGYLLDRYEMGGVKIGIANNDLYTQLLIDRYPEIRLTGIKQELEKGVFLVPKEYFECPTLKKNMGYAVHHFAASWQKKSKLSRIVKWVRYKSPSLEYIFQNLNRWRAVKKVSYYERYLKDKNRK